MTTFPGRVNLEHPPTSLDFAPSDFQRVMKKPRQWFHSHPEEFCHSRISNLVLRWDKCRNRCRQYVEKLSKDEKMKGGCILMLFGLVFAISEVNVAQYCEKDNEEGWSYHGSTNEPKKWKKTFPKCAGKQQSPLRITTDNVFYDRKLQKLNFIRYDIPIGRAKIVNNGHTVMITPRDGVRRGVWIDGVEFSLEQFHFHWGSVERPGAEHTINHIRYPMEVHFVHRDAKNKTGVVGLLVDVREPRFRAEAYNDAFLPIIEALPEVTYKDQSTELRYFLNLSHLLPENPASFYRYTGSLTTPPCDQLIVWSILRKTTFIRRHELDFFLSLYSVTEKDRSPECLLTENYRPAFAARRVSASW